MGILHKIRVFSHWWMEMILEYSLNNGEKKTY